MRKTSLTLYLIRHADAVPLGGLVVRDVDRVLSERGEAEARVMGKALRRLAPELSTILTSPLTRARQTGEIIARELATPPVLRTSENLVPGFRAKTLLEELLAASTPDAHIAVIGHQPDMAAFVSYLVADSTRVAMTMVPGAVAKIQLRSTGTILDTSLHWLLTPDAVRALEPQR